MEAPAHSASDNREARAHPGMNLWTNKQHRMRFEIILKKSLLKCLTLAQMMWSGVVAGIVLLIVETLCCMISQAS